MTTDDPFQRTAHEFVRKLHAFREHVLQCCVDCGYTDISIREWVHAPSGGSERWPTEVLSGKEVIAKMWLTGLEINRLRFEDDYTIRMFASSDVPAIALKLAEAAAT